MNRPNRNLLATVRFAVFTGALMFVCAYGAYAQDGNNKNTAAGDIKAVITGIPGDNADGSIETFAIDQRINRIQPTDGSAGKATFSVMITKRIDLASPRLSLALVVGTHLRRVIITSIRIDPETKQVSSYTITLSDVLIHSIRQRPVNATDPASKDAAEYEDVTFTFGRIEWAYRMPNGSEVRTGWDLRTNTHI